MAKKQRTRTPKPNQFAPLMDALKQHGGFAAGVAIGLAAAKFLPLITSELKQRYSVKVGDDEPMRFDGIADMKPPKDKPKEKSDDASHP